MPEFSAAVETAEPGHLPGRAAEQHDDDAGDQVGHVAEEGADGAGDGRQTERVGRSPRKQEQQQEVGGPRDEVAHQLAQPDPLQRLIDTDLRDSRLSNRILVSTAS